MTFMRYGSCLWILALALIIPAFSAGCTTSPASPASPPVTTAAAGTTAGNVPPTGSTAPATAPAGIDTTVTVHYNDFACINIPHTLGVEYLNPGEQYTIWVTTPGPGTITPNLLVVNDNDNLRFSTVTPAWDNVQKTWTYSGITPLLKLIDITSPQSGTITIKNMGWYFLCIDDRKETGASGNVYQVPVRVTPA